MKPHKATCHHRVAWFANCPWCRSEDPNAPRLGPNVYPFWRNVVRMEAKVNLVRALINNALDSLEEHMARREEALARTEN